MEKERMGSVKIARAVRPGVIDFVYTDLWSVGDRGTSTQSIRHMGESRCACSAYSFEIAEVAKIRTHYLEQVNSRTIRVEEFSVPHRPPLSGSTVGRVLPVEWIWRSHVYGTLWKRIKEGKIDPVTLGFTKGKAVTEGMILPKLRLECTTKFESVDRPLSDDEARDLAQLSKKQWNEAWKIIDRAVTRTNSEYDKAGLMCPDGKLELGMDDEGNIVIVDVFATQDESRIIRKSDGEIYSKDLIRNYLWSLPWKAELDAAKVTYPNDKSKWPPYPELPVDLLRTVSQRYAYVARAYADILIEN